MNRASIGAFFELCPQFISIFASKAAHGSKCLDHARRFRCRPPMMASHFRSNFIVMLMIFDYTSIDAAVLSGSGFSITYMARQCRFLILHADARILNTSLLMSIPAHFACRASTRQQQAKAGQPALFTAFIFCAAFLESCVAQLPPSGTMLRVARDCRLSTLHFGGAGAKRRRCTGAMVARRSCWSACLFRRHADFPAFTTGRASASSPRLRPLVARSRAAGRDYSDGITTICATRRFCRACAQHASILAAAPPIFHAAAGIPAQSRACSIGRNFSKPRRGLTPPRPARWPACCCGAGFLDRATAAAVRPDKCWRR